MKFNPPLKPAKLIQRYKRFLADVVLDEGIETTIHVANTGAMTGCAEPNSTVWYSTSDNPKRKYPYSWELSQTPAGHFICVNTARANQLAVEAIQQRVIPELSQYHRIETEVKYGEENSRIDILLTDTDSKPIYIEVKSVTLLDNEQGFFPDAVTKRGQKHLRELMSMIEDGKRAVLLFTVLHTGINSVQPASHIDPEYSKLCKEAQQKGVEFLAYKAEISQEELRLSHAVPVII